MGTERVAVLDGRREARAYDGSACLGILRAPAKWVGLNAVLVRVSLYITISMG